MRPAVYTIPVRNEICLPAIQPTGMLQQFSAVYPVPERRRRMAKTRMTSWSSRPAFERILKGEARQSVLSESCIRESVLNAEEKTMDSRPYAGHVLGSSSTISRPEAHFGSVESSTGIVGSFDCLALFQHHRGVATSQQKQTTYNFKSRRRTLASIFQTLLCKILHLRSTDEIPYRNIETSTEAAAATASPPPSAAAATATKNGQLKTKEPSETNKLFLESPIKRRSKAKNKTSTQNESSKSPRSIAERRLEKKKAVAKVSISETISNAVAGAPLQNGAQVKPERSATPPLPKVPVVDVPRFFFPKGVPISMAENEAALRRVSDIFSGIENKVEMIDMAELCRAAGIPVYWKRAVYDSCCNYQSRPITLADFASWWNRMTSAAHDEASRFVYTLAGPHRNYLTKEDFAPILQDLIETFPGLHFLREAQEFHCRYVETVTVRIFWAVNRSWTGRITANELRRSNFLETVRKLETTDDINAITNYFSYEHFYVIYCKFYELDKDHDLIINKIDMSQHANGALPPQIIDRIFSGAVTKAPAGKRICEALETIGYTDFVAFLLAEEDKRHPTSVEYWFRCLDLDGDGLLSLYEMEYFYNGVKSKMDQHNIDSMRFDDVVCNLLDLIRPRQPNAISLSDLKKCPLCTRFLNTFVNWVKYYEQEASEGERATVTDGEEELNDWDRYCLEEYEALMADDQDNDEPEDINLNLDDDDDLLNGSNVSTTVNMSLRDFGDSQRTKILEAI